jgi:hypothetical protein
MKYVMLIHHAGVPTPESAEWQDVPADERAAVYRGYQAINETPGSRQATGFTHPRQGRRYAWRTGRSW